MLWSALVGWVIYELRRGKGGKRLPLWSGGALFLATLFAVLDFMLGLADTMRYYMSPTGAHPAMLLLDVWNLAYVAIWALVWGAVATGIVAGVRIWGRRGERGMT